MRSCSILTRRVADDDLVVLGLGRKQVLELRGTACELWRALETPVAPSELVTQLAGMHDTDPQLIANDVLAAVDRLAEAGLVETVD